MINELLRSFPEIFGPSDEFATSYQWLKSDWPSISWVVLDPYSPENIAKEPLTFNSVLRPNVYLSDELKIVEDIKRSIAISIELSTRTDVVGAAIGSLSVVRHRFMSLKRIYRELEALGLENLSQVDGESMRTLVERLSKPETVSRKYAESIEEYLSGLDVSKWPITVYRDNKKPASINRGAVCLALGLSDEVSKGCALARDVFYKANITLSKYYPKYDWGTRNNTNNRTKNAVTHSKSFMYLLQALDAFYLQSQLAPEHFNYPLNVCPTNCALSDVVSGYMDKEDGKRTRNVPVNMWMKLMDSAVRFVLDYAGPLKQIEKDARGCFEEIKKNQGSYVAGKKTGLWLRQQMPVSGHGSPFPLSAFGNFQERSHRKKYDDEYIDYFKSLMDSGMNPKRIRKELDLTKSQYDHLTKVVSQLHIPKGTEISLHTARYCFLPLSCTLILLAFTAGRESSINTLKAGCIKEQFGDLYIDMFIPKTLRRYDLLPTVEIVKKAVEVLEDLSKSARAETGDDHLMQFRGIINTGDKPQGFRWENTINRFLEWIGLDTEVDGVPFDFSEHQFRRFFAMMFFYRYDKKYQYTALMRFMRHIDWGMTSIYLTERVRGAVMREVALEKGAAMILDSVDGKAGGLMADEFKRKIDKTIQVSTEKRSEYAMQVMEDGSYVFDFVPDGLFFGRTPGKESASKCKLEMDGDINVMTHRALHGSCSGCPNLLTTNELKLDIETEPKISDCSPILEAALQGA